MIGWLIAMFLNQGPIAMSLIVIVIGFQVWLFRSRWGLRTRAVGEHPKAAETVGIDVIRLRYQNVLYGGVLAGLAGAYLSMEASNSFQAGMTGGRGFIGLAAMIVGRWTPIGAFGAALLFSSTLALGQIAQVSRRRAASSATSLAQIPGQFFDALPYLVTIVVLAGVRRPEHPAGRRRPAVRARGSDLTREERDRAGAGRRRRLSRPRGGPRAGAAAGRRRDRPGPCGRRAGSRSLAPRRSSTGRRSACSGSCSSEGFDCVPVNPNVRTVLGVPAFRDRSPRRSTATGPFDMVDVFRRSELCVPHAREAVAAGARCLWLQLGVVNWEAARIAHDARPRS